MELVTTSLACSDVIARQDTNWIEVVATAQVSVWFEQSDHFYSGQHLRHAFLSSFK